MLGAGSHHPDGRHPTDDRPGLSGPSSTSAARQFHAFIGVNPLQTTGLERGTVSGRVALLLRSAEIQPSFVRFVSDWNTPFQSPPIHCYKGGSKPAKQASPPSATHQHVRASPASSVPPKERQGPTHPLPYPPACGFPRPAPSPLRSGRGRRTHYLIHHHVASPASSVPLRRGRGRRTHYLTHQLVASPLKLRPP